jgi:hypothetical protein
MAQFLAPIINESQLDDNGEPLTGGFIYVYLAGSSTPAATTSDKAGGVPNAYPIVLDTLGLNEQGAVWLTGGASYKFVIKDAAGATLRTIDNVSGINDTSVSVDQWVVYQTAPTYVSANSFTVAGDQTSIFQPKRRVKTQNTAGFSYGSIISSAYVAPNTTVTLSNTSGVLDSGLSQVSYGLVSATDSSIRPTGVFSSYAAIAVNTVLTAASVGGLITIGAPSLVVTLPLGSSLIPGDTFTFQTAGKFTLTRSGADQILGPLGLAPTIEMYSNCSVTWNGSGWVVILGGDATASAAIGAGNIGRLQMPGGLLVQWGSSIVTLNGSGVASIVYPSTFGSLYTVVLSNGDQAGTPIAPVVNTQGNADFSVLFPGAGAVTVRCNWIAFGVSV